MMKSDTLFVIIGSHKKEIDGYKEYTEVPSVTSLLKPQTRIDLLKTRCEVFDLIKSGKIIGDVQNLRNLSTNEQLVWGKDLRGDKSGGLYLPAYIRFSGRLYSNINPRELLINGNHHILILTGLYGLVTPEELIQHHEIDVNHDPIITRTWKIHNILTKVLTEFIETQKIKKVIDLTANDGYRRLIKWGQLAKDDVNIFHCYCKDRSGDSQLMAFAGLIQEWQDPSSIKISLPDKSITSQNPLIISIQDTQITITNSEEPPDGVQRYEKINSLYLYNMYLLLMFSEIEQFLKELGNIVDMPFTNNERWINYSNVQDWFFIKNQEILNSIMEIKVRRDKLAHGISIENFITDDEYLELLNHYLTIVEYANKYNIKMPDKPPFIQEFLP